MLLYLSPAYVTRENCRKEVALAVDYGKRLLPILLPGTPWPLRPSHGAHAGEIAGHITGKVYISAQAEGGDGLPCSSIRWGAAHPTRHLSRIRETAHERFLHPPVPRRVRGTQQ